MTRVQFKSTDATIHGKPNTSGNTRSMEATKATALDADAIVVLRQLPYAWRRGLKMIQVLLQLPFGMPRGSVGLTTVSSLPPYSFLALWWLRSCVCSLSLTVHLARHYYRGYRVYRLVAIVSLSLLLPHLVNCNPLTQLAAVGAASTIMFRGRVTHVGTVASVRPGGRHDSQRLS